jgi:hypothetical protein
MSREFAFLLAIVCLVVLAVCTIAGAAILRLSISIFNAIFGGAKSLEMVPQPTFGYAVVISLVMGIVCAVLMFGLGAVTGVMPGQPLTLEMSRSHYFVIHYAHIFSQFIASGVGMAVMLPTTFNKGMALTFIQLVIVAVLFVVALGVYVLLGKPVFV